MFKEEKKKRKILLMANTIIFFCVPMIFIENGSVLYTLYGIFIVIQIYLLFFLRNKF